MSLTKEDLIAIENVARKIYAEGKHFPKDQFKRTEKRLFAYPLIKQNIERYWKDIDDIKHEDFRRSRDVILYKNSKGGEMLDIEQIRAGKILLIEQKIIRNEKEIKEIDSALNEVKKDPYFEVIPMYYFERKTAELIAIKCSCNETTLWRNRKALIEKINIVLYGVDAL